MTKLTVNQDHHHYDIFIGHGLLNQLADLYTISTEAIIITDDQIPEKYLQSVMKQWPVKQVLKVSSGEASKCFETYESLIHQLMQFDCSRSTYIIGVGGGVIGDLAGFVAATYMRGVPFINIPTSLLAMVDASIGGKVAINVSSIKNLIGTFYRPTLVVIDPTVLSTLSKRHLHNGYAEIIKTALIKDEVLFEILKSKTHEIEDLIVKCLEIKKALVELDPYDQHERHLLNYGHTIGHALETIHSPHLLHGECVAIGMKKMAKDSDFETALDAILKLYELDIDVPIDNDKLLSLIRKDKKRTTDSITVAYVKTPGKSELITIKIAEFSRYL